MGFGVFMHRSDSIYDDRPEEQYQFPQTYLRRAKTCVGDWVVYLEPRRVPASRGYYAMAKVQKIVPDPTVNGMFLAVIEPGSYLEFASPVAFNKEDGPVERGLLNDTGKLSGRAQAAVRPLSRADFARIVEHGLKDDGLPRLGPLHAEEGASIYVPEMTTERLHQLTSRAVRNRVFRQAVVRAYDSRCAITGLKLINGKGRAEVEAAHIRSVEHGGPDLVNNGLALSGTVHWLFDRGMISLSDDLKVLVSRQSNDPERIRAMINPNGMAHLPQRITDRPAARFLAWHREHCFKN